MAKFDPRSTTPINMLLGIERKRAPVPIPVSVARNEMQLVDGAHPDAAIKAYWPHVLAFLVGSALAAGLVLAMLRTTGPLF